MGCALLNICPEESMPWSYQHQTSQLFAFLENRESAGFLPRRLWFEVIICPVSKTASNFIKADLLSTSQQRIRLLKRHTSMRKLNGFEFRSKYVISDPLAQPTAPFIQSPSLTIFPALKSDWGKDYEMPFYAPHHVDNLFSVKEIRWYLRL